MAMACRAVLAALLLLGAAHAAPAPPRQKCQRKCGDLDIPYPFGIGAEHCMLPGFEINCNDIGNGGVLKPFLGTTNVEVLNISLSTGQVWVLNHISSYCYNASSGKMQSSEWEWDLTAGSPYTLSDTANKFVVVGCRTLAFIGDSKNDAAAYETGCVTMCRSNNLNGVRNGSCNGMGCCQTAIPSGLQFYAVWFDSASASNSSDSPCSYAMLVESSKFNFQTSYLTTSELHDVVAPVVLDWAVRFEDCDTARTMPGYACVSSNSGCINGAGGQGYRCICSEGFHGNPYLPGGCQDIDECEHRSKYHCFGECVNTEGNYTCSCPVGTQGNPLKEQCRKDPFPLKSRIIVGISGVVLVALVVVLAAEVVRRKRSNKRQVYFEQHGGQMLSRILKTEGIHFTFFDRGDIVKATSNFRKANNVGEGAHGAVYKGTTRVSGTTTTVAVKRCKKIDKGRKEEFVQELVILCRVNHPNIVKLLGCCLHFEAPMLVYEFAPNGTLNHLIHGKPRQCVKLATRLRIAAEVAEALAHLHSPPHTTLHGDVKPENILLGEGWVAKVSDFGCSTLDDNVQVMPKGTLAYLDPEFVEDQQIKDKTDVYSLGVVLMELLTGKNAKEQKNLTIIFQEAMGNGTLREVLDADIIVEEGVMGVIQRAAELASRCTTLPGKTRPAMGQVAEELRLMSNEMPERPHTVQALESPGYISTADDNETTGTTGFYSVGTIAALSTELAR